MWPYRLNSIGVSPLLKSMYIEEVFDELSNANPHLEEAFVNAGESLSVVVLWQGVPS